MITSVFDSPQTMTVVLGAHDISKKEKTQQRLEVATYFTHPNYKEEYDYDIMLLKVKRCESPYQSWSWNRNQCL